MSQTQFQRITDLSRLNWKGWLLLLLSIVVMFACIIFVGMQPSSYGSYGDNRGGRKILGIVFAFMAFGGFILIAVGLRKVGISIWKDGMDPYIDDEIVGSAANVVRPGSVIHQDNEGTNGITGDTDVSGIASETVLNSEIPFDPSDLL